jgi:hypothetical protein
VSDDAGFYMVMGLITGLFCVLLGVATGLLGRWIADRKK